MAGLLLSVAHGPAVAQPVRPGIDVPSVAAKPLAVVRVGDHPGFGRIVVDLPVGAAATVTETGERLLITISGGQVASGERAGPRNVRSVTGTAAGVTVQLVAGSTVRRAAMEQKLIIDVLDPPTAPSTVSRPVVSTPPKPAAAVPASANGRSTTPTGEPRPAVPPPMQPPAVPNAVRPSTEPSAATGGAAARSEPAVDRPVSPATGTQPTTQMREPDATAALPATQVPPPERAPASPSTAAAPIALAAVARPSANSAPGHVLMVPFAPNVGAAAYQRGRDAVVVFDERKPVDLLSLRDDAVFGAATIQLLPGATVLRVRLPPSTEFRLTRQTAGWSVMAIGGDAAPPPISPIRPVADGARLLLPAASPGMVVSIPDSETGGILVVGTQREAGQGVVVSRRAPDVAILASWQGVVIEPLSDAVFLSATARGFLLGVEGIDRALVASMPDPSAVVQENASRLSRSFDFPDLPVAGLLRRLQSAVSTASAAPPQGKTAPRRRVAEAMLSLGLASEAQGVLGLGTTGDARADDDPAQVGLQAIAALLAGRAAEADGLDDARLSGTDEIEFWRAARTAQRNEVSPTAAQSFATTSSLLQSYPEPLRARLLPLAVETMALGGQSEAAQTLADQNKNAPSLDLARGFLQEVKGGDPAEAMAIYDRLAASNDRLTRLRAGLRAAELRLSLGQATPAKTAEALTRMLYAWRGDDREIDLRQRVAHLQSEAGLSRPALQLLRETEQIWPERRAPLRAQLMAVLARALAPAGQAQLAPFDLIALAEENADLMPGGDEGLALAERIGEKLIELDLPGRAIPVLEKLVKSAPAGAARAAFGGRLASMRQQQGDPAGAIEALTRTVAETLPPALLESRTLTFAASVAAQGDMASADRALDILNSQAGDRLRGELKDAAKDWPGATAAWRAYAARIVPADGKLDQAQAKILVRLASAAAQAGDDATLTQLRQRDAQRLPAGETSDLFNLLTSQSVRGTGDLGVVASDVAQIKAVPAALSTLANVNPKPSGFR